MKSLSRVHLGQSKAMGAAWSQNGGSDSRKHSCMADGQIGSELPQSITKPPVLKIAAALQDKMYRVLGIEFQCKDCHVQWKITLFNMIKTGVKIKSYFNVTLNVALVFVKSVALAISTNAETKGLITSD